MNHLADGGMRSRKLLFAAWTSVLVFVGGMLAPKIPGLGDAYGEMVLGLVSVLTVFTGGNVAAKGVLGSLTKSKPEDPK